MNRIVQVQWRHHKGRGHGEKYHDMAYSRLTMELGDKVGAEASRAVSTALDWVEDYLKRNPGILRGK